MSFSQLKEARTRSARPTICPRITPVSIWKTNLPILWRSWPSCASWISPRRRGLIHEAHEGHERHNIGRFVFHIETGVILGQMVGRALRVLASFSWEKLIGDTYLDVIRFAGKQ